MQAVVGCRRGSGGWCGSGPSPSRDGADTLGQGRIGPAAGHPLAQRCGHGVVVWKTRGVDQAGNHADGSGVMTNGGRAKLRPECSRRPGTVERADVAVARLVVDQCEQFAGRGDLGDVLAAASFDALFVGRDLGRVGWRCTASIAAQQTAFEPCLVMCPRCTTVSDSRWRGVSPAHEHRWAGWVKRCTSPISATKTAASTDPIPDTCWIA